MGADILGQLVCLRSSRVVIGTPHVPQEARLEPSAQPSFAGVGSIPGKMPQVFGVKGRGVGTVSLEIRIQNLRAWR